MKFLNEYFEIPENCKFVSFGSGHINETWCVSCGGQNIYALRKYNPNRNYSEIYFEHINLLKLRKIFGEKIVAPVSSRNKKTIEKIEGKYYALFPFIEGVAPENNNSKHITLAAEILAELHKKLWIAREGFSDISLVRPPISKSRVSSGSEIYRALISKYPKEELNSLGITNKLLLDIDARFKEILISIDKYIREKQLIHGDFGSSNLLIDKKSNTVNAILDWEEMRWDSSFFELAGAIGFYEMDSPGAGEVFISAYLNKIKKISHPNQESIFKSVAKINDGILCANYYELTLMVENDHFDLEYIQELCQKMA